MTPVFIILAVFTGISLLVGIVALAVLVGTERVTIPGTIEHRIKRAQGELQIAQIQKNVAFAELETAELHNARYERMIEGGSS